MVLFVVTSILLIVGLKMACDWLLHWLFTKSTQVEAAPHRRKTRAQIRTEGRDDFRNTCNDMLIRQARL